MSKFQFPLVPAHPDPRVRQWSELELDAIETDRKQIAKAVMLWAAELCDNYDGPDDEHKHARAEASGHCAAKLRAAAEEL